MFDDVLGAQRREQTVLVDVILDPWQDGIGGLEDLLGFKLEAGFHAWPCV